MDPRENTGSRLPRTGHARVCDARIYRGFIRKSHSDDVFCTAEYNRCSYADNNDGDPDRCLLYNHRICRYRGLRVTLRFGFCSGRGIAVVRNRARTVFQHCGCKDKRGIRRPGVIVHVYQCQFQPGDLCYVLLKYDCNLRICRYRGNDSPDRDGPRLLPRQPDIYDKQQYRLLDTGCRGRRIICRCGIQLYFYQYRREPHDHRNIHQRCTHDNCHHNRYHNCNYITNTDSDARLRDDFRL